MDKLERENVQFSLLFPDEVLELKELKDRAKNNDLI
jgi:hypothetical protein